MFFPSQDQSILYNVTTVENNITYSCIYLHLTSVCRHVGLYTNHDKISNYSISIYLENAHKIIFYRIRNCVLQNKFRCYSIFVSVTYIMKLYDKTILATFQNVLVNNAYDCNMYILVIIIKKELMISMYKIILLMYDQLHSYMMMYTTVLFIVYSICMYLHFYSGQYLFRPSMQLSLYLYKGNSNIENFVFIHPWVYKYYFDFG